MTKHDRWLQQQASLHIVVIIWKESKQLFCCCNRCIRYMCIDMNLCTHWCACHCNAHCVSAVNRIPLNPSASLGAYSLPSGVFVLLFLCFCFHFLFSFIVSLFSLLLFVYLMMICVNAAICRLFDPLPRGHSHMTCKTEMSNACIKKSIRLVCMCKGGKRLIIDSN